ncbi:MAG: HDIG domain-containing protein [Sedimentisphaerales bacterium]|nr:HDIG domain-containing protein [Sedimentisphaerales bacterium]
MKAFSKKKAKRLETIRSGAGEKAEWFHKLEEAGIWGSLPLLLVFVILSSFLLSVNLSLSPDAMKILPSHRTLFIIMAIMILLSISLGFYILAYEPRVVKNHLRGFVMLVSLLIMIGLVRIGVVHDWPAYLIIIPVMVTAMMMTIAYSQRFALGVSAFLGMVCFLAWVDTLMSFQEGLGIMLAIGSGTAIAILLLREIRTRTKLIEVSLVAAIYVFAIILLMGLWRGETWKQMLIDGAYGSGGALFVGFVMQGLLPVIERVFRTATNMTLLDYSEATKPLLKRLAVEAPGTFNHSWQIGMLAEAAADAIGANGLLCRVGSYYHDVGKLVKPRYFVENQADNFNQHKELAPTMSRMIIVAHVNDGLELLKEYRIPKVLHQFAATHHGTTVVEFFFHEAAKKESQEGRTVADTEFRYPGPKPNTREAAIVMLADAVEGATRAMKDPTPSRIESLVHTMAMKRLQDDQFDDCDLTMRELHLIEESLVKSLCGMYHGRIAYPKQEKPPKQKEQENQQKVDVAG